MSLERGSLKGLRPLEEGLAFAANCMVEIINQLEEAYEVGDSTKIENLYTLFERYTGRLSLINEAIDKLLAANMEIVNRRWGMGGTDVS